MKLIIIGASWCRNCVLMRSRWLEVAQQTGVLIEYHDFDQSTDIVSLYRVQNAQLPACIVVNKQNQELTRFNGLVDTAKLVTTITHFREVNNE